MIESKARDRDGARSGARSSGEVVALCVGFGLLLAYAPIGTVGTACITSIAGADRLVLASRCAYFVALALALLLLKALRKDHLLDDRVLAGMSFVGVSAAYALLYLVGTRPGLQTVALLAFAVVAGAASAVPLAGMVEGFMSTYRRRGSGVCISLVAASSLVSVACALLVNGVTVRADARSACACLVIVAVSAICYALVSRDNRVRPSSTAPGQHPSEFRASIYIRVIMVALGVVWALAYSLSAHLGFGVEATGPATLGIYASGVVIDVAIIALCWNSRILARLRFGLLMRWILVVMAISWAFMPTVAVAAAPVACFLCAMGYLLIIACGCLLVLEVARDHGRTVTTVLASCLGWATLGDVIGTLAFGAFVGAVHDALLAYSLVSAISVAALALTVPFLPSVGSAAADFAQSALPENEGLDARIALHKRSLATSRGLSAREAEVLDLIVAGLSRKEIARRLSVSPSTVKNHTTAIYRKAGVHSARELSALLAGMDVDNDARSQTSAHAKPAHVPTNEG